RFLPKQSISRGNHETESFPKPACRPLVDTIRAMNKIECSVRFLTPAFVGDARQNGAWRTPPFKAQLRQFWRMVMAESGEKYQNIRRIEARLFGHAWLEGEDARKSRVRL